MKIWSPEHCLKLKMVAGSATCQQSKYEVVLSVKVSLFIRSWKQREFVYLVCSSVIEDLFLLPPNYIVHLEGLWPDLNLGFTKTKPINMTYEDRPQWPYTNDLIKLWLKDWCFLTNNVLAVITSDLMSTLQQIKTKIQEIKTCLRF